MSWEALAAAICQSSAAMAATANVPSQILVIFYMLLFVSRKYGHVRSYFVGKITRNIMMKTNNKSDVWFIRYSMSCSLGW